MRRQADDEGTWVEVGVDAEEYAEDDDYGAAHEEAIRYVEEKVRGTEITLTGVDYMDDDWGFHIGVDGPTAAIQSIFGSYIDYEVDGGYWGDIYE